MTAKSFWVCLLILLGTGAAYAAIGPDSLMQNLWLDKNRAAMVRGKLFSWDGKPVGNRHCFLLGPGKNNFTNLPDGIPEGEARKLLDLKIKNWQADYRDWFHHDLFDDVAIEVYCYNSDLADPELADNLRLLMEADPDMTQAGFRANADGHSKMGNILYLYWLSPHCKLGSRILTLGTPHLGAPLASEQTTYAVVRKAYAKVATVAIKLISGRKVNFNAPGQQWLTESYPPMMDLRKKHPLDSSWYLYAGEITPMSNTNAAKIVNGTLLADAMMLAGGFGQEPYGYSLSSLLVKLSGDTSGNDGMVTVSSAWASGYEVGAHKFLMKGYNHSQMLQGRGDVALHRSELVNLIDFVPPGSAASTVSGFSQLIPAMPEASDIWLVNGATTPDLSSRRCLGWTLNGEVILADAQWNNQAEMSFSAGYCAGATWWGDKAVLLLRSSSRGDLYELAPDGKTLDRLTNTGKVEVAGGSSEGNWLLYIESGSLLLRSSEGWTKCVVTTGVTSDCEPYVQDDQAWWYQGQSGSYQVYSAPIAATSLDFAKTTRHDSFKGCPFMVGSTPAYVAYGFQVDLQKEANQLRVTPAGVWRMGFQFDPALQVLARIDGIGEIAELRVDTQNEDAYIRIGQEVRWIDRAVLIQNDAPGWSERIASGDYKASKPLVIETPFDAWALSRSSDIKGFDVR